MKISNKKSRNIYSVYYTVNYELKYFSNVSMFCVKYFHFKSLEDSFFGTNGVNSGSRFFYPNLAFTLHHEHTPFWRKDTNISSRNFYKFSILVYISSALTYRVAVYAISTICHLTFTQRNKIMFLYFWKNSRKHTMEQMLHEKVVGTT